MDNLNKNTFTNNLTNPNNLNAIIDNSSLENDDWLGNR